MEIWIRLGEFVEHTTTQVIVATLLAFQIAALITIPNVLLRRRGRPTSALLWLVVLVTLPPVGIIGWWLIGHSRIERRLRKHNKKRRDFSERRDAPATERGTRFDHLLPQRAYEEYAFSSSNNQVKLLTSGKMAYEELERRIDEARQVVNIMFYLFRLDDTGERFLRKMMKCRERGVQVRLLVDGIGSHETTRKLRRRLKGTGIEFAVFFPARLGAPRMNFVNHRKIITIDNQVGFLGGINIGDEYEIWKDLMVCLDGPSVQGLDHIFLEDWYFATQVALSDPSQLPPPSRDGGVDVSVISSGPDTEDWIHDAYFLAITQAQERIFISTPYFIPPPSIVTALRTAAGRGVDVRLVLPSLSDVRLVMWASRSFYRPLVDAGVRIFEYGGCMLHGKALVKDRDVCSIGSANVDNRSFRLNFEICSFLASESITQELARWIEELFDASREITAEELERTPLPRKLLESAAHLMSPLL